MGIKQPKLSKKDLEMANKQMAIPSQSGFYLTQLGYEGAIAPDVVILAIATYLATGTAKATQELTGTSHSQLSEWKAQDWYQKIVDMLREEQQVKLDAKLSSVIDKSLDVVVDRLEKGDYVMTKEGLQTIPVSSANAAKILNTVYDKRALSRGEATKIVQTDKNGLQHLQDVLKKIAQEKKPERVIPGEATRI